MANGVSKNPSFHTDFKNVNFIVVKIAPKKLFCPFENWLKTFNLIDESTCISHELKGPKRPETIS
jgi:hypothetical protein